MGCSPSKGKLFSKPEAPGSSKALLIEGPQHDVDSKPEEGKSKCLETIEKENAPLPTDEHPMKEIEWSQLASDTMGAQNTEDIKETEVNVISQEKVSEIVQTDDIKKTEKRKKNKGKRRSIEKHRQSSIVKTKVDIPPYMVRAHQAAYAFLNPNISKYETLLGLLDQTAQTQLSIQPTMSALVLRFEEINQALEEMAEEGELMLKEHGVYMALPSGMMGPAVMPAIPRTDPAYPPNPPPDLLQQLLQHSTEKMRQVGCSVQALGDTTIEDAVEYYSSLSKLLVGKLQAKQAAEQRLARVLAQVEGAAIRKSNPEDSALHSEDSGIGGENESLTGSERLRRHRGSAGSGSCGSGINIRGAIDTQPSYLANLAGYNEDDEEDEEEDDDDDDDEEYEDNECDRLERKRSNSSPPDPSQTLLFICANYMKDRQPTVKRPLTAVTAPKPEHASLTRNINIMTELQKSQRDLDQRMKKIVKIQGKKEFVGPHYSMYRAGLRRHSVSGLVGAQKGPFRTDQSLCSLPTLAPQPPKHCSVRGLINTFSQGVDGRPGQSLANIPPHIRRPRKNGILQLSDTINSNEGGLVINGNNNNNSWPEGKDDLDVDNLPPPPPEVLMDDSFQSTEGIPGNKERSQEDAVLSVPTINQKTVSQRLKSSIQNVEVLPNRASMKSRVISILPTLPVRQDVVMKARDAEKQPETDLDAEIQKVNCLYHQARKMIHPRNAGESPDLQRDVTELTSRGPSPLQARMGQRSGSNDFYDGEVSSYSLPVTAPPVSRVRLPPSCPSVCHRYPSPPAFRPQSTSRPSSRPSSPIIVTRATESNTEEIIPSVSFQDARSVFCQKDSQNFQTVSLRGRLPMRGTDTRRTQSEQRPSLISHSEFSKNGCAVSTQAMGSETVTTKYRPNGSLMKEDNAK